MNHKTFIILLFCLVSIQLFGQYDFREYSTNDSTEYILNNDTTIVVSKTKLYFKTKLGIEIFSDFTTLDTTMYIRDFDIIAEDHWYLIFGDIYWGGPSKLYKSIDKGTTWAIDSTIYPALQEPLKNGDIGDESLYQIQRISEDTILFFISYYQSGIFYSIDAGQNWDLWFANYISFYKGLFKCDNFYYLWGQEGDGFPGSMFSFHSDLLLSPDTNNVWNSSSGGYVYHPDCYNGSNPDCIFAPNSLSGYDQFLFFENYINENCSDQPVGIKSTLSNQNVLIYPNPSNGGTYTMEWNPSNFPA